MSFKEFLKESANKENPLKDIYRSASNPKDFFKAVQTAGLEFKKMEGARSTGRYVDQYGNTLNFYSITTYKNSGRLRLPEKTRFEVYADLVLANTTFHAHQSISFGKAIGEGPESDKKIEVCKEKAAKFAKTLGIILGKYDFAY